MSPTCGLADAIGELVDDQAILIGERRRHALAFDARDLEAERDDQRGVDRRRGQRLEPGDQLFADAARDARRSAAPSSAQLDPAGRLDDAGAPSPARAHGRRRGHRSRVRRRASAASRTRGEIGVRGRRRSCARRSGADVDRRPARRAELMHGSVGTSGSASRTGRRAAEGERRNRRWWLIASGTREAAWSASG